MTLRELIRADFDEFIRLDPSVPEALKNSLRLTERVPAFVDKLTNEVKNAERAGHRLDRLKIKEMVYSLTGLFVHLLKTKANEMEMSDMAKSAMKTSIEGDEIIKKFDDQGNADLSEELGVIITDKG
jgi:hypothetical protein